MKAKKTTLQSKLRKACKQKRELLESLQWMYAAFLERAAGTLTDDEITIVKETEKAIAAAGGTL